MADTSTNILMRGILRDTEKVFSEQLGWVLKLLEGNPDFKQFLLRDDVPMDEKKKMMDDILGDGVDPQVNNLLMMLASGGRLNMLESLKEEFDRKLKSEIDLMQGTIETAFPITPEILSRLEDKFTAILNQRIKLSVTLNEDVLGGIRVMIGDKVFDGTIESRLKSMRKLILSD